VSRVEADLMLWLSGWYVGTFFLHRHDGRILVGIK
jgi:hypothetical protein